MSEDPSTYGRHLDPRARPLLEIDGAERIVSRWSRLWVGYPKATEINSRLDIMLMTPPSDRPRNLLVFGESNVGKTTLLKRWAKRKNNEATAQAKQQDPDTLEDWAHIPVVRIETPARGDEGRLYENILAEMGFPLPASYSSSAKLRTVLNLLRRNRTGLIILDEFHNALSGRFDQLLHFNVVIKNLSNETGIPLVVASIETVDQVFHKDDQLHRRFHRIELTRWPYDENWRKLLRSFEVLIPLRHPSNLGSPEIAKTLHDVSSGRLGDLSDILMEAALRAVLSGEERITRDSIQPL